MIEVRDSRTGYLVPGHDGSGLWPDGKIVGTSSSPPSASSGNSDWHSGQETILGVFKLDFDSYKRYQDFETGVLHRISSRFYLEEWFGLGSHCGKNAAHNYLVFIYKKMLPWVGKLENCIGPKCDRRSLVLMDVKSICNMKFA